MNARDTTRRAFDAVRRRAAIGVMFVVAAHAALGAAFGAVLAWMGQGGPWAMLILALLAAVGSGAWAAGRMPAVPAGSLIERRFPGCRNVLVTADELLSGELDANDAAAARVFQRAADVLARIDPVRAASIGPRIGISVAVIAASAVILVLVWRNLQGPGL